MAELVRLKNGMEVLLEENHAAKVVSLHLLVKVGSVCESKKEAGMCHLIEHMLFKGTPTRKVGEIAREVESLGGEINAFTSFDETVYYINMASRFVTEGLGVLADAVKNPLFDEGELEREKEVVLEEIRRGRDIPQHRIGDLTFQNSFTRHPYGRPIIGFEDTVKKFTRDDVVSFYRRWYVPEKMTLIVVGDFEQKRIRREIVRLFGDMKPSRAPHIDLPTEPKQRDFRSYAEEATINSSYFSMAFHIPSILGEDTPALDLLAHVLGERDSSRLRQEIVEKKGLAEVIYTYPFISKYPGLFIIGGITRPERLEGAISSVWEEISKVVSSPLEDDEITSAKINIRSEEVYERETAGGQAGKYAYFIAVAGDHEFEKRYYESVDRVDKKNVMEVAGRYLVPQNATLTVIVPKGARGRQGIRPPRTSFKVGSKKKAGIRGASPDLISFSNGLKVIIAENPTVPIVACVSASLGGLRAEGRSENGISNMVARTITKGAGNMNALQVAKRIESIAGAIDGYSGKSSIGIKAEFLSSYLSEGISLFLDTLLRPSFLEKEVAIERRKVLSEIKNQEDALATLAFTRFLAALFPTHPYGMDPLGKRETVNKIGRSEILDYYRRIFVPDRTVIAVVGDMDKEMVLEMLEERLSSWERRGRAISPSPEKRGNHEIVVEYKRKGKEQAHIVLGFMGPSIRSKDQYSVAILNHILSGQGGRLFLRLRDEMGLAYAVGSSYFVGIEHGYIAMYIATEPSKVDVAISGMKEILRNLVEKGVSEDEIRRAKNYIVGAYELEKQRNMAVATAHAYNVLYGLGIGEFYNYTRKIMDMERKDILACIEKYIHPSRPVISIVRPN